MSPRRHFAQGFTLLEVMIAATVSIIVIMMAISAGLQLQRRGMLEERIMETQNASRAARDMMAFGVQSSGAALGSASLTGGSRSPGVQDVRYAVWPTTQATFVGDTTFVLPPSTYSGVRSDALEVWETDPTTMVSLKGCGGSTNPWNSGRTALCTQTLATRLLTPPSLPPFTERVVAVVFPGAATVRPWACLGVVTGITAAAPPGVPDNSVTLTLGLPGRPTPAAGNCDASSTWSATGMYLLPVTTRSYRVNWPGGMPTLEVDADGIVGDGGYTAVSRDVEQLRVRMGVVAPNDLDGGVRFFPEATPARPALDQCTHATCASFVTWTWDGGTTPPDRGVGSAGDELMRHVQVVELALTARSQRLDAPGLGLDGGVDRDGNINDGYKRRHTVVRLAPRNFGYVGTDN